MNTLTRWDPFREMMVMRRTMDRLFDRFVDDSGSDWDATNWSLALDVVENDDAFVVKASIPGINPDNLDITFTEKTLTIKGTSQEEAESDEGRYHLRERRFGHFARSISLPRGIKADEIEANYNAGVLTLTLPKAEEIKPKRISVQASTPERMIEGKVSDIAHKN